MTEPVVNAEMIVTARLDAEMFARLQRVAREQDRTVSSAIRLALAAWLDDQDQAA